MVEKQCYPKYQVINEEESLYSVIPKKEKLRKERQK